MRDEAAVAPFTVGAREREVAMAALREITDVTTIGAFRGTETRGDGVAVWFGCTQPAYPDWRWEVVLAKPLGQDQATVVEAGLLPTDGSLLAPDWVPWSERLAEYRAGQEAALQAGGGSAGPSAGDDEVEASAFAADDALAGDDGEDDDEGDDGDDDPDEDDPGEIEIDERTDDLIDELDPEGAGPGDDEGRDER
ncbi:MAG TPA: DUF3027 domain-containing protein [Microbacteriaceae bacterium]|nr:DUF3027 domain-containing protein [Microbacteriaceae bacterium]